MFTHQKKHVKKNMSVEHQVSQVLSCNTCHLCFETSNEMREHYKTNFHRFNLKRKTAGLRPVPQELFEKKVAGLSCFFLNLFLYPELQAPQAVSKGDKHIKQDSKKRAKGTKKESDEVNVDPEFAKTETKPTKPKVRKLQFPLLMTDRRGTDRRENCQV